MTTQEHLSRREVLIGRPAAPVAAETHISSLVVHVRTEWADAVRASLDDMPGVEIHAETAGKFIVTLETESEADIVLRLNEISLLDGVMSAALVYHHFEPVAEGDPAASKG